MYELSRRPFSRSKHLRTAFGRPVLSIRSGGRISFLGRFSKSATDWDIYTPAGKQVMTIRGGSRMYFHSAFDNSGTDLFLNGAYWKPEGATLHMGTTETGPTVARIISSVSDVPNPLDKSGKVPVGNMPTMHQYTLSVVKGFDIALACASVAALDGDRFKDSKKRHSMFWII